MSKIHNIRSVAKYESKLLKRSWFYRIFVLLAVVALCFFNFIALISEDGGLWILRAIPSNIPYVNLLFLNTGQAIIAVFLSSEFLKSDKKLDTSEVFYVHPLSNADYVMGKIWGNMQVFLQFDLIIIILVILFNLAGGVPVDGLAYIIYFFLICIPTLIFIFGLSVGLMLILKNQAITFVILLGYIALTLFYIGDKFYYVFDYMVYNLPLIKSDIVGFTNLWALLNHRFIYLFLGLGFICLTIFLFRRLPNSRQSSYRWLIVSFFFIIIGSFAAYNHIHTFMKNADMRTLYTSINNKYVHTPKMVVDDYELYVEQHPETISSKATMKGRALETSSVFTFCLNPGLQVREIIDEQGTSLSFERDYQIILVDFGRKIALGDSAILTISYDGVVNEQFCYLDIPSDLLEEKFSTVMFGIDKKYSFQTADFILFTPETYWYPRPGTSYSSEHSDWQQAYFSNFNLKVKTLNGLKALSQGTMEPHPSQLLAAIPDTSAVQQDADTALVNQEVIKTITDEPSYSNDHLFTFSTDFPSPSVTLIIGDYEQKSIDVDSVAYSIWHLKGHDYFTPVLGAIVDTIPTQLRESRRSFEAQYSLDYSFNRFSIVEVPVQFFSYARTWTQAQEKLQPEMVLFPERGCLFDVADVTKRVKNEKRWAQYNGQEITDDEAALRTFNAFLWTFRRLESDMNWSSERGAVNITVKTNPYFIFPQLYNFRYNIFSSEWPIANRLIELYLQDKSDNNNWIRQMNGISNSEKANLLIEQHSFKGLLADEEQRDLLDNITALKANDLFAYAERNVGYQEYRDSLRAVLKRNIFTNLRFESLLDTMGMIAEEELNTRLDSWNYPTPLPVYVVGNPEVTQISNRGEEVFVLKLQITNDSDNDGIIHVTTNVGGGRFNVYDPRTQRKVSLAARETKMLVSHWDEAPRNVHVNTLVSANLPNLINLPITNIQRERNKTVDEEGDYLVEDVSYEIEGEVIVDNEDSTLFILSEPDVVGLLPKWLDQVGDNTFRYSGVSNWSPPLQWTLTTNEKYYGTHIRSAYVIKSGNGSQTATWKIPLPAAGSYDLYYHVQKPDEVRRRGRRGGRGRGDAEYSFKVKYNDEEEDAYIDIQRSDEGWSILGTYYFSEDTVQVVLTNECKLRSVTADAVKVVRR